MSRCRACNMPLQGANTPILNHHTGQEEDLCCICGAKAKEDFEDHEYVGGNNPRDGATAPTATPYE